MRQRAYSIRTRIKTARNISVDVIIAIVREHIPLEQGLRLLASFFVKDDFISQRAYSIRTRIKTLFV